MEISTRKRTEKSTGEIELDRLFRNKNQPRQNFDQARLEELADSIRQHGLMEPIVAVRRNGGYMIVAGERRWRASKLAGLHKVPVRVIRANDNKVAELALLENLQREDLNLVEEAKGYQALVDKGYSREEIANKMGFKQSWRVQERLNVLKLDPLYQDCLVKGIITPSQAQELSRLSEEGQRILFQKIKEGKADTYNKLRSLANGIIFRETHGEQTSLVEPPSEEELRTRHKYDRMVDSLLSFIERSYSQQDLQVLKSVVTSDLDANIEKLDMVIGYLHKIKRAMIEAQGLREA